MLHGRAILVHATSVASWVLFLLLKSLRDWYYGSGSMTLAGTTQLPLLGRTNLDVLATKAPAIKHRIPTFVLTARTSKLTSVLNLGAHTRTKPGKQAAFSYPMLAGGS
jgi:hypothetical protein